jgi:hypothetical protein
MAGHTGGSGYYAETRPQRSMLMPCLPGFSRMKAATHSPACVSQPALFGQRLCGVADFWSLAEMLAPAKEAVAQTRLALDWRRGEEVRLLSQNLPSHG